MTARHAIACCPRRIPAIVAVALALSILGAGVVHAASDESRYAAIKADYLKFLKSEGNTTYRHNWLRHINAFLRLQRRAPKSARAPDAVFMAAGAYVGLYDYSSSADDLRKAVKYYDLVARAYPKSKLADDALFHAGETLERLGDAGAKDRYAKCVSLYPKGDMAPRCRKARDSAAKPAAPAPTAETAPATPEPAAPADDDSVVSAPESVSPLGEAIAQAMCAENAAPGESAEQKIEEPVEPAEGPETLVEPQPVEIYAQPMVTSVQHWSNPDYTRLVIEVSEKVPFDYHLLEQKADSSLPRRLYLDFSGAKLADRLAREDCVTIQDGLLQRARIGQYQKDVVRVVLDIESIDDFQVFPMVDPFRVVIDVSGRKRAPATPPPPKSKRTWTVIIDPGHGGTDPGAMSRRGDKEALLTLAIAREVQKELSKDSRINAVLTRGKDYFITLPERPAIANKANADLFVSVHINAASNRSASGIEVYHFSPRARREDAELVAAENATSAAGVREINSVLMGLTLSYRKTESNNLAAMVLQNMLTQAGGVYGDVTARKVRTAPFYVLMGTKMPAILVECGFITNPEELARLKSVKYQQALARGIADGVRGYFSEFD